jgi:hypothetical protein
LGADPQQKRREMRAVPQLSHFVHQRYLPFVQTYKNSWQTDETVLRIHNLPKLGSLALDEIKTDAVSKLNNCMRADGYAAGTLNRVFVILRCIYNLARKWKVPGVIENPAVTEQIWREEGIEFEDLPDGGFRVSVRAPVLDRPVTTQSRRRRAAKAHLGVTAIRHRSAIYRA